MVVRTKGFADRKDDNRKMQIKKKTLKNFKSLCTHVKEKHFNFYFYVTLTAYFINKMENENFQSNVWFFLF